MICGLRNSLNRLWSEIPHTQFALTYGLLLRDIGRTTNRVSFEQALKMIPTLAAMNNLGSVLKDVARYDEALVWLRKGSKALHDNPAAHSNVLFTLVGYELEPADSGWQAQRFAERFGQHPFERWRDRIRTPSPTAPEDRSGLPRLLPSCGELLRGAATGALEPTNT